jgi:sugar phosphate isomerase/epimerase
MDARIKVLIDPLYVNPYPFHLIPKILGGRGVPLGPFSSRCLAPLGGSWVHRAFGPGRFDGMDLGFGFTDILDADLNVREKVLEEYGSKGWPIYSFHATFGGGSPLFADTRMELTEDNERTRRGLRNQVLVAARLKSHTPAVIVLHLGRTAGDPAKALERSLRMIASVVPLAEESGLILALENMPRCPPGETYLGSDYRDLQRALRTLRSPAVKVCLDWGHANNYSRFFARDNRREPLEQYVRQFGYVREMIDELGKDIGYAHIHYNRSHILTGEAFFEEYDEHMALSRIPLEEREAFAGVIARLVRATSVQEIGLLNLELIPKRFFGIYKAFPTGSTLKEQLASVTLLRQMVAAGLQTGVGARARVS